MMFDEEQKEIIGSVRSLLREGRSWNRYNGDVTCRVVARYITKHLDSQLKTVGPNVYVEGLPIEFDLLVVQQDAEPFRLTAAYPTSQVVAVLEVKLHGLFAEPAQAALRIKQGFEQLRRLAPRATCLYLTISEVTNPKRPGSIDYLQVTRDTLSPYPVFSLQESRSRVLNSGEWKRLIETLGQVPKV